MNQQQYNTIKSAAEKIDVEVVNSVYPEAFLARWDQLGGEMPKTAAERDMLIGAAYDVAKAKAAQYHSGMVPAHSSVARIADMAKRAAIESGVESPVPLEGYDLSGAGAVVQGLLQGAV